MINSLQFATFIYWGSYLLLVFFVVSVFYSFLNRKIFTSLILFIIGSVFVRARFIEPNQIVVKEQSLGMGYNVSVAVISDIHLGAFKDRHYLQRIINTINRRNDVDMLFIAGDFLNNPTNNQHFDELFAPLKDSTIPIYAVLGNHDIGIPGIDYRLELIRTLEDLDVTFLHNDVISFPEFFLVGLGPHMGGEDDVWLLNQFTNEDNVVVLTHNPDSTTNYLNTFADLTIVGHTHCGQIRPPFMYNSIKSYILPVEGEFDCGFTQEDKTKLFITPGIGEVALPMRFANPPTINILHL